MRKGEGGPWRRVESVRVAVGSWWKCASDLMIRVTTFVIILMAKATLPDLS